MRSIRGAFSTPILVRDWDNAERVNEGLEKIILHREAVESAKRQSDTGNWDSKKDLLQWPCAEVRQLRKWIGAGVREITLATTRGKLDPSPEQMLAHAWANVSRTDSSRMVRNHNGCTWSGVYCVKSMFNKTGSSSGDIEFLDPRMLCIPPELPGSSFGSRVRVSPRAGRLVIFPNWLHHYINPVEDDFLRICIVFNIKLEAAAVRNRVAAMEPLGERLSESR